jgi:hypothetical protein
MIPEFLAMIERLQRADVASVSDEDLSAFLFVFYLLGEWRDPRTYRPLLRLLRHEPELLDALLGDAITEGTGRVVAGVCDGDLLPIVEVVRDGDADSFVGAQMFDTLVVLALSEPLKQAPIVDFLRSFPDHTPYGTEAEIWSAWAFAIAALGLADMKPQRAVASETCAPLISPNEPRISVVPFSTSRPLIRADVLAFTL